MPQTVVYSELFDRSYTTIVLTNLGPFVGPPLRVTIKEGTNTTCDFLRFIIFCLRYGHLLPGDYLVIDNAKIHSGNIAVSVLLVLCSAVGVFVHFMPVYSPEFSPAELVHAFCKQTIIDNRDDERLAQAILMAHATVTFDMMARFYSKCVL